MSGKCPGCRQPVPALEGPWCEACTTASREQNNAIADRLRGAGGPQFVPLDDAEKQLHDEAKRRRQYGRPI